MPNNNCFNKVLNKVWHGYSDDVGRALIHLGAAGWFFSSLAQLGMLSFNKQLSKNEKKFLIPQEITDATVNISLYYTICQSIKSFGGRLLENAKITTKGLSNTLNEFKIPLDNVKKIANSFNQAGLTNNTDKKHISNIFEGITEYFKGENTQAIETFKNLEPIIAQKLDMSLNNISREQKLSDIEQLFKKFKSFKNGIGVVTAVGASVIASSIITPILRNTAANYVQKTLTTTNNKTTNLNTLKSAYSKQLPQTFNKFKI